MSARRTDVLDIVSRYAAGYFPLYNEQGEFYWERLRLRAVVPLSAQTVARARHMAKRGARQFDIRKTTAVEAVLEQLQREEVKERTWVKEEVAAIYRTLHAAGLLRTVEAWDRTTGQLAGALLGIVMPGTFVAETMFSLMPDASKVCLCRLVEDCHAAGFAMIDVQTPHDVDEFGLPWQTEKTGHQITAHPCVRLGEKTITLARFMRAFESAWKKAFDGDVSDWIAAAAQRELLR